MGTTTAALIALLNSKAATAIVSAIVGAIAQRTHTKRKATKQQPPKTR